MLHLVCLSNIRVTPQTLIITRKQTKDPFVQQAKPASRASVSLWKGQTKNPTKLCRASRSPTLVLLIH